MRFNNLRWINRAYWFSAFVFLFYFIVFHAPKKGFDLSDHGFYATTANNFLYGVFNECGFGSLANSLLIKLGFGYLSMARFFYFLEFFSGLLFLMSLRLRAQIYWVAPIAITLMLTSSAVHLLGYESSGAIFLMLATSLLFFGLNYSVSKFLQNICFALSAIFYVYSSVTNLILSPSLLVNAIILFFIYPRIKNKTFIITYILAGLIALYLLIFKVLPVFELTPFQHPGFLSWALKKAFKDFIMLLVFIFTGFFVTKIISLVTSYVSNRIYSLSQNSINTITIILATFLVWVEIRLIFTHWVLGSWQNSLMVYGFLYLGVILAIYGWRFYQNNALKLLALALLLHTEYYLALAAADGIVWSIRALANASQICLIVLLWLECCFIIDIKNNWRKFLVALLVFFGAHYSISTQLHYAPGQVPKYDTEKVVHIPRLNGLYMAPDQLTGVRKIVESYYQYHCQDKLFISRQILSLFYYIFDRIGYSPLYFTDSKGDLRRLVQAWHQNRGYCFMGDNFFEKASASTSNDVATKKLAGWLNAHSKHIIYLPINGTCCVKDLHVKLYVG